MEPDEHTERRVVQRGLHRRAPFHRSKNSTADTLLIELYGLAARAAGETEPYGFVTSNHEDFSDVHGDRRLPHPDITEYFHGVSTYFLGLGGLEQALSTHLGEDFDMVLEESDFQEDPRTLAEIVDAEQEFFDRVWFERSKRHTDAWEDGMGDNHDSEEHYLVSKAAQERVLRRRPDL